MFIICGDEGNGQLNRKSASDIHKYNSMNGWCNLPPRRVDGVKILPSSQSLNTQTNEWEMLVVLSLCIKC